MFYFGSTIWNAKVTKDWTTCPIFWSLFPILAKKSDGVACQIYWFIWTLVINPLFWTFQPLLRHGGEVLWTHLLTGTGGRADRQKIPRIEGAHGLNKYLNIYVKCLKKMGDFWICAFETRFNLFNYLCLFTLDEEL